MLPESKRLSLLLTVFVLVCSLLSAAGTSSDAKALFDRYQSVYKEYREAIQNRENKQTVSELADELKSACQDYYGAIGVKASFDSEALPVEAEKIDEKAASPDNQIQPDGIVRRKINPFREELNQILADLSASDSELRLGEIQKRLEDLIARCTDPEVRKESVFKLAEVVFDSTNDLRKPQAILLRFAKGPVAHETRRQAFAMIKMLKKKSVLIARRHEFKEVQQSAISKWGNYSKTAWLAVPVKIWKLGSYLATNFKRKVRGKSLDKALDEYDKAVFATYPKGSCDALTKSRIVPLNRVKMLVNGRTSFHYRMEHAKRAQSTIYVQTLLYMDDAVGNQLTDILCERARSGVDVRLILDDCFSFRKKGGVIQRLKNAGVQVLINNPIMKNIFKANFRSHQKLFILDETIAIVGGMNIGEEYAKGELEEYGWRDTDVEVRGPVVREIMNLFERNWEELTLKKGYEKGDYQKAKKADTEVIKFAGLKNKENLIRGPIPVYFDEPLIFENVNARFVTTFPIDENDDDILDLFEIYLSRAKKEVIFESAYFIPPQALKEAIAKAVARGVEVKIITNSIESNNHPSAGWAGRHSYEEVLRSGARIFEWRGAQTIHSKVSLFDNFAVTLGAYNVNSRSHTSDSEDIIALEDLRVAMGFRKMLLKDLARCKEITLDEVQGWNKDFMKKAKIKFFNLFKSMF